MIRNNRKLIDIKIRSWTFSQIDLKIRQMSDCYNLHYYNLSFWHYGAIISVSLPCTTLYLLNNWPVGSICCSKTSFLSTSLDIPDD